MGRIIGSMMLAGLGTLSFAAHQVALTAESLSYMPGYGFAVAAATLVGQSLGARKYVQAHRYGWEAAKIVLLVMCGISLAFLLFPEYVIRLHPPPCGGKSKKKSPSCSHCISAGIDSTPNSCICFYLLGCIVGALLKIFRKWKP